MAMARPPNHDILPASGEPWWRQFFDSPDCLRLGRFPDAKTSQQEAEQVARLLGLRPGTVIADVPCGPGRHMPVWIRHGCTAVGLDASPRMLRLAVEKSARAGARPMLVAGLMQKLPFADNVFDAFVCLFNSFGYLDDDEENGQVIAEASRCLRPGGALLLDTRNPPIEILTAPYREPDTLADGRVVCCSSRYDSATRRLNTIWSLADTGQTVYIASIRLYGPGELKDMFETAGLSVEGLYGDFVGTPFRGDHGQLVILGRKR
jgi:SAM-dependent methyltransferase